VNHDVDNVTAGNSPALDDNDAKSTVTVEVDDAESTVEIVFSHSEDNDADSADEADVGSVAQDVASMLDADDLKSTVEVDDVESTVEATLPALDAVVFVAEGTAKAESPTLDIDKVQSTIEAASPTEISDDAVESTIEVDAPMVTSDDVKSTVEIDSTKEVALATSDISDVKSTEVEAPSNDT
jgi:hypothetical protein